MVDTAEKLMKRAKSVAIAESKEMIGELPKELREVLEMVNDLLKDKE